MKNKGKKEDKVRGESWDKFSPAQERVTDYKTQASLTVTFLNLKI